MRRAGVTTRSRDTLSQLKKALSLTPSEEDLEAFGDKTTAHWDTILGLLAEKHPNGAGANSMLHYSKALQVITALESRSSHASTFTTKRLGSPGRTTIMISARSTQSRRPRVAAIFLSDRCANTLRIITQAP